MPYLDDDIVDLRRDDGDTAQYYWGDEVKEVTNAGSDRRVKVFGANGKQIDEGRIRAKAKLRQTPLLRMSMIDVQQGEGMIFETPGGKVIFVDGGDNQLFARHAAARFRGTSEAKPLVVDLMLVTHGDADHFDGLNELRESETNALARKRIFVAPKRYYHNGLVKRPTKKPNGKRRKDTEMLGPMAKVDGETFAIGLVDDPASLAASERNKPFKAWTETLEA